MTLSENKPRKSNMIFSCGPDEKDRQVVPSQYYRKDEYDIHYYKLTAPLFVRRDGALTKVTCPVRFVARGDVFWGGSNARDYRSKVVDAPTYRSLLGAAKSSQKRTQDYHHSFIEGVTFEGFEDGGVMILRLQFGS